MNKYVILLLVTFSIMACTKESDKQLFNIQSEVHFNIPAGLNVFETHYFYFKDIPSNYIQHKTDQGIDDKEIVKVLANRAIIEPRFQDIDYSFINDISLKLYNDDEPKTEAFYLENIDFRDRSEVKLLSSLPNLKNILSKETYDLEIRINFKTFTPSNTESIIKLNFSAFATN